MLLAVPSWAPKAGLIAAVVVGGGWYFMQPSTYEECMLSQMRGQPQSMQSVVHKLCARRHKLEFPLTYAESRFSWMIDESGFYFTIKPNPQHPEYIFTRAAFRFATNNCKDAAQKDWEEELTSISADGDVFLIKIPRDGIRDCMKGRPLSGRYR